MKSDILTRQRLELIRRAIEKHGGAVSVRFLLSNHFIQRHIVDQAVDQGYLAFETLKPPTGRPSLMVREVSKSHPTEPLPCRESLEGWISIRHWRFAFYYAMGEYGSGCFDFKRRAYVAYQRVYPSARSKAGARASASRLLSKDHIQAAIQWEFARNCDPEIDLAGLNPRTTTEIWDMLNVSGSWRSRWAPWWVKAKWVGDEL